MTRRVVVVGGGISGLAAAWHLISAAGDQVEVTILEAGPEFGGKLMSRELAGVPIDVGAEAMLATRPEAVALVRAVGLADEIVHPATTASRLYVRGRLVPMPSGLMMGAPTDLHALATAGVLGPRALFRIPLDFVLPRTPIVGDVSVGEYITARLGRGVVDLLVDPLLGGVYSGRADTLSLEATVPMLFRRAKEHRSLLAAAREAMGTGGRSVGARSGPIFAGLTGGVTRLATRLEALLAERGVVLRTGVTVRELSRDAQGWHLLAGPTTAPELADVAPEAAADLATIEYASVAVVNLAYRSSDVGELVGSGFLAPPIEGGTVKAATYLGSKWDWIGAASAERGVVLLRASVGRYRDAEILAQTDESIAQLVHQDLARALPIAAEPSATLVTRWGGALPQYAVGHVARVDRIKAAVSKINGLAVCGAAFDGVGIAACIGSAQAAAVRIAGTAIEPGE
jgi:oxygen-dependent protoporphyrinogen oxidase